MYWRPDAALRVSSDGPGLPGSQVDLMNDLGARDHGVPAFGLVLQPARRHRIRFEYLPIRYDSTATLAHDVAFSGSTYRRGDLVRSSFAWDAVNIGYEYDFIARPRLAVGAIGEAKLSWVRQELAGPTADLTRTTSVPAPALGAALRVSPDPRLTLYAEFRGFVVPDGRNGHFGGRYVDLDAGGTIGLARHVGLRAGLRWLNIRHLGAADTARMSFPGVYAGVLFTR